MRLRQYFNEFIAFGLQVDRTQEQGGKSHALGDVLAELGRLLARAEADATAAGKLDDHVEQAAFALVAWADERLAHHGFWRAGQSLQIRRFNTHTAGNQFFTRLDALAPDAEEVREVFHLALSLGFQGQFEGDTDPEGHFSRLKRRLVGTLRRRPIPIAALTDTKITPQPYELPAPPPPTPPSRNLGVILGLIILLALLGPLAAFVWVLWTPGADIDVAVTDPRPRLRAIATEFTCAKLDVRMEDTEGGPRVHYTGFLRSQEDLDRLNRLASQVPGVGAVSVAVEVHAWPFCEILRLVLPYETTAAAGEAPFVLEIPGGRDQFQEGEELVFQVRLPPGGGHLTLIYVNSQGGIVNLYPRNMSDVGRQAGGAVRTLEQLLPGVRVTIRPPFGEEMFVGIVTPTPLFDRPRDLLERPEDFLPLFSQALATQGAGRDGPYAQHLFLTTLANR